MYQGLIESIKKIEAAPKVICLVTYLRAGSKLFHSLLDWHPQIISFPRILQFNGYWNKVEGSLKDPEHIVDTFIEMHPRFFSGTEWYRFNKFDRADQLGPEKNETFSVDIDRFRALALEAVKAFPVNRRNVFIGLNLAYHFACGRKFCDNSIILYHIHDLLFVDEMGACLEDFPKASLIVTTRHPVEGMNSCLKWMLMQNTLSCAELFSHQSQTITGTDTMAGRFPRLEIRALPYERLNRDHRKVMEAFVSLAGIEWDEILMKSTLHRKLWWSNGRFPRNGTDPNIKVYTPKGFLERNDWKVLCALTREKLVRYGYLSPGEPAVRASLCSLLMPTATEWEVLKGCLNPFHWMRVVKNIKDDLTDERIKGYDYYNKEKIKNLGFARALRRHLFMVNPLECLSYYFKRVRLYVLFSRKTQKQSERLPAVL